MLSQNCSVTGYLASLVWFPIMILGDQFSWLPEEGEKVKAIKEVLVRSKLREERTFRLGCFPLGPRPMG